MRKYVVAGLLVWVPIIVTVGVIKMLLEMINSSVALLPDRLRPEALFGFDIPGFSIILMIVLLFITGVFAANFVGNRIVALWESLLSKIPLVRSVYKAVKQSMEVICSPSGQSFRQVVMIEYPRKGIYSLGFVTNNKNVFDAQAMANEKMLTIFLPTTPNPTSGFLLFLPEDEVTLMDIPVDEALKAIISLGTVVPAQEKKRSIDDESEGK